MATFSKTVTTKTNSYTVTFDDGTTVTRNAKKDYSFAVIYKAEAGPWAGQWRLQGLSSDAANASKAASSCKSDFRERRIGRYFKSATPVTVSTVALAV
tara:strand:- start:1211 stop:1504 length:294 start_codon:yes stop_codon:yes gene_type:complete